ncbi:hypothetical protein [Hyphomicrobium sp. 99]|uniref:hypothetical protein n=1 Tax=Hyphomicrobium sp. 99 TaxID=1163419 RepID=UPI0018CCBEC2|nr:hypothetical protein [Hyphomicrobium sp. 99]
MQFIIEKNRFFALAVSATLISTAQSAFAEECKTIANPSARLACYDRKAAEMDGKSTQAGKAKADQQSGFSGWEIHRSKDSMTDKVSCLLLPVGKPHIQISSRDLYISYRARGGVGGFQYRIDNNPPSGMQLPTQIEQQIGAVHIGDDNFQRIMAGSRLRVTTLTVLGNSIEEDIPIGSAKPVFAKMMMECPD